MNNTIRFDAYGQARIRFSAEQKQAAKAKVRQPGGRCKIQNCTKREHRQWLPQTASHKQYPARVAQLTTTSRNNDRLEQQAGTKRCERTRRGAGLGIGHGRRHFLAQEFGLRALPDCLLCRKVLWFEVLEQPLTRY
jgi:hypothetical protein